MAPDQYVNVPGSHRTLPADARRLGPGDAGERLTVTMQLRSRFAQGRSNAAEALASRPPGARRHLSHEEFDVLYGAGPGDIALAEAFATEHDLDVLGVNSAARTVKVAGTRRQMEDAFRVELFDVRAGGGTFRGRTGPVSIPLMLAPVVQGVFGLDDRPQAQPHFLVSQRKRSPGRRRGYPPRQVAGLYGLPAEYTGRGQTIALIELGGGFSPTEVSSYFDALNLPCPQVTTVSVDGARNRATGDPDGPDGEVLLDIEVIGSVAPEARIVVYFGQNTSAGFLDAVHAAVHDPVRRPSVVSICWGSAEQNWPGQLLRAMDEAFESAALLGVTVCAASGDDGSADDVADGRNHVDFPASSPYVLGCGGTCISSDPSHGLVAERGWGGPGSRGASGGGYSRVFGRPSWQQINRSGTHRGVPDVAGNADPASGSSVLTDGSWRVVGGTSAAASLWSAIIACANQRLGRPVGFVNSVLYANTDPGVVCDIIRGTHGAFTARQGWDAVTGLGSPGGGHLLSTLAASPRGSARRASPHRALELGFNAEAGEEGEEGQEGEEPQEHEGEHGHKGPSKPTKGPSKPTKGPSKPTKGPSKPTKGPSKPSKKPSKPSKGPTQPTAVPSGWPSGFPFPSGPPLPTGGPLPTGWPVPYGWPSGAPLPPGWPTPAGGVPGAPSAPPCPCSCHAQATCCPCGGLNPGAAGQAAVAAGLSAAAAVSSGIAAGMAAR